VSGGRGFLISNANAQSASGSHQATVGWDCLQAAHGLAYVDRSHLLAGEGHHFAELARRYEFHRNGTKHGAQGAIERGWCATPLEMTQDAGTGFLAGSFLHLSCNHSTDSTEMGFPVRLSAP